MSVSKINLPKRNVPLLLLHVRELVMARFRPMLNEAGVTEQQWRVLRALITEGSLEPRQIVMACCLSSASLVGILVRMEDLGIIHRKPIEGDQRKVLICATAKGKKLVARLAPRIDATYARLEKDLGSNLMQNLIETLDTAFERLGSN